MNIRTCPDCNGKGKLWRPPNLRQRIWQIGHPEISSTAVSTHTETLPEYEPCPLCLGRGEVRVQPLEDER